MVNIPLCRGFLPHPFGDAGFRNHPQSEPWTIPPPSSTPSRYTGWLLNVPLVGCNYPIKLASIVPNQPPVINYISICLIVITQYMIKSPLNDQIYQQIHCKTLISLILHGHVNINIIDDVFFDIAINISISTAVAMNHINHTWFMFSPSIFFYLFAYHKLREIGVRNTPT